MKKKDKHILKKIKIYYISLMAILPALFFIFYPIFLFIRGSGLINLNQAAGQMMELIGGILIASSLILISFYSIFMVFFFAFTHEKLKYIGLSLLGALFGTIFLLSLGMIIFPSEYTLISILAIIMGYALTLIWLEK